MDVDPLLRHCGPALTVALATALGCQQSSPADECASADTITRDAGAQLVFLDFDGPLLVPGPIEDASLGVTPLVDQPVSLPPFDGSVFGTIGGGLSARQVTAAVGELLAPLNVAVTDSPPEEGTYVRVAVGGSGEALGFAPAQYGVAVESCEPSRPKGAVAMVFSESIAPSATLLLSVIGHEVGHALGLVHGANELDIMYPYPDGRQLTWLPDDVMGQGCGSQRQDPLRRFPSAAPTAVSIAWPPNGATVAERFPVVVATALREGVTFELHVDGCLASTSSELPFGFVVEHESGHAALVLEASLGDGTFLMAEELTLTTSPSIPEEPWLKELDDLSSGPCKGVRVSTLSSLGVPRNWRVAGEACDAPLDCASGVCLLTPEGTSVCARDCAADIGSPGDLRARY